jgi:hypothetical protein
MYRRLSEAKHGWHYFRQQRDAAREMLDECAHVIIHLEHHVEQQDLELEDRAVTIADLEQQLQVLQLQVPQRLQHPLSPTRSQMSTRSRWQTCWEGRGTDFCYFEWIG